MEVQFSPEVEAEIARRAASSGKEPAKFVEDVVSQVLTDEARFMDAVERGFASLDAGRFVEHDEVGKRIEQSCRRPPGRANDLRHRLDVADIS